MTHPLHRFDAAAPPLLLPPQWCGSVAYYALMAAWPHVAVDAGLRYDKRFKGVHRMAIADTRGRLVLTVPVSRPAGAFAAGGLRWDAVTVSAHGRWWEVMPVAFESAYGRTPFFEYYIDRLLPLFDAASVTGLPVTELDARADAILRGILGLETEFIDAATAPETAVDLRHVDFSALEVPELPPYWQLRRGADGPLSVLDLIFNLGPEAPLYLREAFGAAARAARVPEFTLHSHFARR